MHFARLPIVLVRYLLRVQIELATEIDIGIDNSYWSFMLWIKLILLITEYLTEYLHIR